VRTAIIDDALLAAGFYKEPNRSRGSHESDWRCVNRGHFSSIKNRACAKCRRPGPWNGRMTRKALRERAEEHRIAAILSKHGSALEFYCLLF
jgi:hypothetical protein